MIRVCQKCGAENRLESVHCRDCGVKLPEPTAGMMGPPPSMRRKSFLRSVFWVLVLLAIGATGFWARENVAWRDVRSGAAGFYASWQNVQTAVSGAFHRWYSRWLSVEPAPAPPPVPAPVPSNIVKIRCQRCGGFGYTIAIDKQPTSVGAGTSVDAGTSVGAGMSADTPNTKKSSCVLCNQNGGRTIILPAGAEVCSACYGMGKIIGVVHGNEMSSICKMCAGKGYIVRKY